LGPLILVVQAEESINKREIDSMFEKVSEENEQNGKENIVQMISRSKNINHMQELTFALSTSPAMPPPRLQIVSTTS